MTTVEIQRPDERGHWRSLTLSRITYGDRLIIGRRFRILVDDEVVYPKEGTRS